MKISVVEKSGFVMKILCSTGKIVEGVVVDRTGVKRGFGVLLNGAEVESIHVYHDYAKGGLLAKYHMYGGWLVEHSPEAVAAGNFLLTHFQH